MVPENQFLPRDGLSPGGHWPNRRYDQPFQRRRARPLRRPSGFMFHRTDGLL